MPRLNLVKFKLAVPVVSAVALALQTGVALASFSPIALTTNSYNVNIVVSSNYLPAVSEYTCWVGSGFNFGDTTYYEQGLYARPGHYAANSGIPPHNTVFTSINDSNMMFIMPPSYQTNDDLVIVSSTTYGTSLTGTLTLATPTTCSNIALLSAGGNGGATVTYTVNHSSGPADTGNYAVPDWFAGGSQDAWGCNGRINNGGYANFSADVENINPPYLAALPIKVSSASPVTSITLNWSSGGGVDNFFALSTSTDGVHYKPAVVTGFNQETVIAASVPFPVTATMDNGTNIEVDPASTFFEIGYDTNNPGNGLPPSGSILTSVNGDGNTFQMGIYSNNNAAMIDSTSLSVKITPVTPAAYSALSFLTAGDSIGNGGVMSNVCVVQHKDGVNETNWVYGYDWTNTLNQGVVAFYANEQVNLGPRIFVTNSPNPELFESFVNISDTTSPVTNISVSYGYAPSTASRTCIMAVSGTTAPFGPLIQAGPGPGTQEWYPHQTATISVDVVGTAPITNVWLVQSNGNYVPLNNGKDANGSTVSGADTTTLTITGLTLADGTNYEYEALSANGSETSSNAVIVINSGAPTGAEISAQYPAASFTVLTNHADVTLFSATAATNSAPPIDYQWYAVSGGVTTLIPGASGTVDPGSTATYANVDDSDRSIFVVLSNFVGMATSTPVSVSIVATVGTQTAYESSVLALKPIAYWPLNEPSGIIAFDRAGTNDGSYIGDIALNQPGIPAAAALVSNISVGFNGSNSYVNIPAGETTLNITGPLTMMQWVLTPVGGETEFTTSFGHSDNSYRISVANGPTVPHFADSGPDVTSPNAINDGNWHLLVGVFDGVNQYLYVDGVEQGGFSSSEPPGNSIPLVIGGAPDYNNRYFTGNIAQCAIFTNALTAAQVQSLYFDAEMPPGSITISPANPTLNVGRNVTLDATTTTGNPVTAYHWFLVDTANVTNFVTGATNQLFTLTNASTSQNGDQIGVIASNAYGSISATVPLAVSDAGATLVNDLGPTNAEALTGTSVTYTITAAGSLPITYEWKVDGKVVSGVTDSSYTFPVESGLHTLQVSCTNGLNFGSPTVSDVASLTGLSTTPSITFDGGVDWATNAATGTATVPFFGTNIYLGSNIFEVTDGTAGEASDGFYNIAQYVGSWTASFVYQVHTFSIPSGDGATFMLQADPQATNAVGADDGALGYAGITQSLALEMDMYSAVGIAAETNGITYSVGGGPLYGPTGKITLDSGNPIQFNLTWTNGVLLVELTDLQTDSTFSTNYTLGPIVDILGSDFAYVGFSGSDGDANGVQWFYDFKFNPGGAGVTPPPAGPVLTVSDQTATSFQISWPTSATGYTLQSASALQGPWGTGPAPTVVGSSNVVTVTVPGSGVGEFYRLKP